jgi:FkbM family methyltransferase
MAVNPKGVRHLIYEVLETGIRFDLRKNYNTDSIVIKEMFEENVYEIHGWHFDDAKGAVIDIGANIGAFSIQAASIGAKNILAVEPEPNNLISLKENIKLNNLNSVIRVVEVGISNFEGTAMITDEGGDSTIFGNDGKTSIKIITLDNLFKKYKINNVNVLKIDVEGSEPEIILSASKENLDKCKYIAIEFDIRTGNRLGEMVMKLSETHHVRTMGSWERGGMIFANRY